MSCAVHQISMSLPSQKLYMYMYAMQFCTNDIFVCRLYIIRMLIRTVYNVHGYTSYNVKKESFTCTVTLD